MAISDRPVRRIVCVDNAQGESEVLMDGPSPDVRTDPARPGFVSTTIWVTDRTPARISGVRETVDLPHKLAPPRGGSVCRVVTFPPEAEFRGRVGAGDVLRYFESMGSPEASRYSPKAPHPYMQQTSTLDFCLILEGEITLVLDTEEVHLEAGDTVIQRGTSHAWRNRSTRPCVIAFSSHDGKF